MSLILYKTVLTFLIVFGLFEMLSKIYKVIFTETKSQKEVFVFIHVKNKEDSIEYIVRSTIFNYLTKYGGRTVPYVVIVDEGSEDRTEEIVQKLCCDYDFVYYTTADEYESFKNFVNRR